MPVIGLIDGAPQSAIVMVLTVQAPAFLLLPFLFVFCLVDVVVILQHAIICS